MLYEVITGTMVGLIITFSTLAGTVATLYFSLKSRTWKRLMLNDTIDSRVNVVDAEKVKLGETGQTISRLAPAGKARINGEIYEVHSLSGFIDQHMEIEIAKIDHQKIFVKLKTQ